jgi:hypothetical protein
MQLSSSMQSSAYSDGSLQSRVAAMQLSNNNNLHSTWLARREQTGMNIPGSGLNSGIPGYARTWNEHAAHGRAASSRVEVLHGTASEESLRQNERGVREGSTVHAAEASRRSLRLTPRLTANDSSDERMLQRLTATNSNDVRMLRRLTANDSSDERMLQRLTATSQARQAAMEGTLLRLQPFPLQLAEAKVVLLQQETRDLLRDATCAVCLQDMCVGHNVCK